MENNQSTFNSVEGIPQCSKKGYKKVSIPKRLLKDIQKFNNDFKSERKIEEFAGKELYVPVPSFIQPIWINEELRDRVQETLKPMHEKFSKEELDYSAVYGIREYTRGSVLSTHRDRIATHHIASILCIEKDLTCGCPHKEFGEDWGLTIVDHKGKKHEIFLEVGEMLIYEAAKLEHGREVPFEGTSYSNLFVHYKFRNHKFKQ